MADLMAQLAQGSGFGTSPVQKTAVGLQRIQGMLTQDKLRDAGSEVIQRIGMGDDPAEILADVSERYDLGIKGTAVLTDLLSKSKALEEPGWAGKQDILQENQEALISKRTEAEKGLKQWEWENEPAEAPEMSPAQQKYNELRRQGYSTKEARQLAYGTLPGEGGETAGDIPGRSGQAVQLLRLMGRPTTRENIIDVMNNIIKPLYGHDDGPDEIELKGDAVRSAARNMLPGETAQDVLNRAQKFYNYVNPQYQSAEQVREAYKSGEISKEEAVKILQDKFGLP